MNHVSLFTGIGGLDLAAEAAGFESVLQVEREPYALRILERHWPNVPRITDVREVHDDERWRQPTVVSGGFPCQPFSAAGKRRGTDDDRYLWPELLRIVEELRPTWVVGENVSGLLSIRDGMEIDDMLASLEARNYEPWVLHYPAAGVGAPHKRDRVFIVGHTMRDGFNNQYAAQVGAKRRATYNDIKHGGCRDCPPESVGAIMADPNEPRMEGRQEAGDVGGIGEGRNEHAKRRSNDARPTRTAEPRMGRVAYGLPDWLDGEPAGIPRVATGIKDRAARLKALGNAVVPAQAYPIFAAIAEAENA